MRHLSQKQIDLHAAHCELTAAAEEMQERARAGNVPCLNRLVAAKERLEAAQAIEEKYECFGCGAEFNPYTPCGTRYQCLILGISTVVWPDGTRNDYAAGETLHLAFCASCADDCNLTGYLTRR